MEPYTDTQKRNYFFTYLHNKKHTSNDQPYTKDKLYLDYT